MKIRVILTSLILLGFLFCLINPGQARMDPWWEDRYPGEHPWQHNDSPGPGDNLNYSTPHIVIIPISFSIKAIQLIPASNCTNGLTDDSSGFKSDLVEKLHFRKKR